MSTTRAPLCLLEETDFSLRFVRATVDSPTPRIEALQEAPLAEAEPLLAAARAVFGPTPGEIVCLLRPHSAALHLAGVDEAKRHAGAGGVRHFASAHPGFAGLPSVWIAAAQARDGAPPAGGPWIVHAGAAVGNTATTSVLEALKLTPARRVSAVLSTAGAFAGHGAGPTWLLEIGERSGHALLVGRDGVIAAGALSLTLDRVADAVQAELGLKFRGSAAKLFLNPDYDFTEAGAKITARLAGDLKKELTTLQGDQPAPVALACGGLPGPQQWFPAALARALELAAFAPDAQAFGVSCASSEVESKLSPAWFGALRFLATVKGEAGPWQATWQKLEAPAAPSATAPAPAAAATPPTPASAATPPAPVAATPVPAKPTPPSPVSAPATAPRPSAPAAPAAKPAPAPVASAPAAKPASAPVASAPAESAVSYPPKASAAAKPTGKKSAPVPAPKKAPTAPTSLVGAAAQVAHGRDLPDAVPSAPAAEVLRPRSSKRPLLFAAAALIAVLAAGGYFYLQFQREAQRLAEEKQRTEQRLQAEAEKVRLAQQKADAEADARRKLELEAAQKLAAAEAELKRAEGEARAQLAARLANARGTLVVQSKPAGASVQIADLPSRTTPATFADIKIGRYPVTVTLAHHEAVTLELEVKENATTETGVIPLVRLVGSLALSTEPAGAGYEVRPAQAMLVLPEARRTGKTPAKLDDLNPGDYVVTFTREGWAPHSETVSITRNATSRAAWSFPSGHVEITTTPAGVNVTRDGTPLGVTPLTLREPPGPVRYVLTFAGYDPVTLSGEVEGGGTLPLAATFAPTDRIFSMAELDQLPQPINARQPELPYYLTLESGRVELQVTLDRSGTPKSVQALNFSNRDLVKFCVAAVEKWKFKPALKDGKPVIARVVVPIVITPQKSRS